MSSQFANGRLEEIAAEADKAQAQYFRSELGNAIVSLSQQIATHEQALEDLHTRSDAARIRTTEELLRRSHAERVTLQRMVDALEDRYPQG